MTQTLKIICPRCQAEYEAFEVTLRVGDLEMDAVGHEVRWEGEPVYLGPLEFQVLQCLMENPRRTLSRSQIYERVWNVDLSYSSNALPVLVSSLRKKLGGRTRILAVRGVGYQLVDRVPRA